MRQLILPPKSPTVCIYVYIFVYMYTTSASCSGQEQDGCKSCVPLRQYAKLAQEKHHQRKFQIMPTASASEVLYIIQILRKIHTCVFYTQINVYMHTVQCIMYIHTVIYNTICFHTVHSAVHWLFQLAPVVFFLPPTGADTGLTLGQLALCGSFLVVI